MRDFKTVSKGGGGWRNKMGCFSSYGRNSSIKGEKKKGARSSQSIAITILAIRTPRRRDVALSIRLPNRFLPSQSSPSPVLICCQIMFASVILTWADCARDSLIIAALDRPRRYCAPATPYATAALFRIISLRHRTRFIIVSQKTQFVECRKAACFIGTWQNQAAHKPESADCRQGSSGEEAAGSYCSGWPDWMDASRSWLCPEPDVPVDARQIEFSADAAAAAADYYHSHTHT